VEVSLSTEVKGMAITNMAQAARNRSTGPKTPEGKARAALNSVKWGLAAKNLLMLGEDEAEYERRANAVFEACAPENAAQAEIVALIFDVMWRLGERAPRIEKALFAAESEELLMAMGPATDTTKLVPAIVGLGKAIDYWERKPLPIEVDDELVMRATHLDNAIVDISSNLEEAPTAKIAELHQLLTPLMDRRPMVVNANVVGNKRSPGGPPNPFMPPGYDPHAEDAGLADRLLDISRRARVIMAWLLDLGERGENAQDEQRRTVGPLSLPKNEELKRLATYTQRLEKSLANRLGVLEQMRKLRPAQPTTIEENGRSREFLYKLRLVK
jgi:hypothetical protein